jgi:hypothetical protein
MWFETAFATSVWSAGNIRVALVSILDLANVFFFAEVVGATTVVDMICSSGPKKVLDDADGVLEGLGDGGSYRSCIMLHTLISLPLELIVRTPT